MTYIRHNPIRKLSGFRTTASKFGATALAIGLLFTTQVNAQIADGKSKFLGNIIGNSVPGNFDTYWNQISLENAGKWDAIEPNQNQFSWNSNPNNVLVQAYNKAQNGGYSYKHHTFIWANQSPGWINNLSANQQRGAIDNTMNAYFSRFPQTDLVDVVNEALDNHAPALGTHQNGSQGWMKFNGNNDIGKWAWIKWSFERAKAARDANGSNAKLLINDYGIVNDDNATQDYIDLINAVNANGQLIEGIGVQAHFAFNLNSCGNYTLDAAQVKRNLDRLAATGLPIYVSEYDMNIGNDDEHDTKFMGLFRTFWDHPAVEGVTLWGYNRNQTWEPCTWLVDGNNERKALQSMRTYVQESTDGGDNGAGRLNVPGILEAEAYASQSGVQKENTTDNDGGQNIGFIQNGDYIDLDVNVQSAGTYKIEARVASGTSGGSIDVIVNNQSNVGSLNVNGTGGWQNWQTVTNNVNLNAGDQTLRMEFKGGDGFLFNVNWFNLEKVDGDDGEDTSGTIDNGGIYTVISKNNMCVDVSGSSSANSANIVQSSCNGGNNQQWKFTSKGDGFYELQAVHSNKCLDVAGVSNDNGANIHQWDCSNGANQQWKPTAIDGGKFTMQAKHSNKCLDLSGGSNANGVNMQQYGCNSTNTNQQFTLRKVN